MRSHNMFSRFRSVTYKIHRQNNIKILLACLGVFVFLFVFSVQQVSAATITWDGGGTTNNWSECANWSADTCPTSADAVVFNATSTENATVDTDFQTSSVNPAIITSINMATGYSGTITLSKGLQVSSTFTQSVGFFTAVDQTLDVNGAFILNNGSNFTASSASSYFASTFTTNAGSVFTHNSGTVVFDGGSSRTATCNSIVFNLVTITQTAGTLTVATNCTLPLGSSPTLSSANSITLNGANAKLTGSGTLTKTSGTLTFTNGSLDSFTGLAANNITVSGATLDLSTFTTLTAAGTLTLSSGTLTLPPGITVDATITMTGGTLTIPAAGTTLNKAVTISGGTVNAPSGNLTLNNNLTVSGTPTFNHNSGTVTLAGNASTISCGTITFNLVAINATGTKAIGNTCTLPLGNNPSVTRVALAGTLSGTGTLTFTSTTTNRFYTGYQLTGFDAVVYVTPTTTAYPRLLNQLQSDYYRANGAPIYDYIVPWAMASKGDKLFLAWGRNDNYTLISSYDDTTGNFTKILDAPEQDVAQMKVFGDTLYIPGGDPSSHVWDAGDLITVDTDTLDYNILTYRYDSDHFVDATTTDANGNFSFSNLKKTVYTVKVIKPADYNFTTQIVSSGNYTAEDSNTNSSGSFTQCYSGRHGIQLGTEAFSDLTIDAGLIAAGGAAAGSPTAGTRDDTFFTGNFTLGDRVWVDSNSDGRQTQGETGMAGVRVELYTKDPYFPCSIHSYGVWVEDGTIYVDYGYLVDMDHVFTSSTYNYKLVLPANALVKSTDGGVTWSVVDLHTPPLYVKETIDSMDMYMQTSNPYFSADIIHYNGYFYRNPNNNGSSIKIAYTRSLTDPLSLILDNVSPNHWDYSTDGVNWQRTIFSKTDYVFTYPTTANGYAFSYNYTAAPMAQYAALVPFRGGVVVPSLSDNKINKIIGSSREEITTNITAMGDIMPQYSPATVIPESVHGLSQRINSMAAVGEYIYAIGNDNKLYISSNLHIWDEVADFSQVDDGAQMITLHYWSEKDRLVIATLGELGNVYYLTHQDVVSAFSTIALDPSANLSTIDNYEPTMDYATTASVGTNPVRVVANNKVVSVVDTAFSNTDLDWTSVRADSNVTDGKSYIAHLTTADGAAATHQLYVPIPSNSSSETVLICPHATSLAEITADCDGGVTLHNGETHQVNGVNVTASLTTLDGQSYWVASGVNGTGGMAIKAGTSPASAPICTNSPPDSTPQILSAKAQGNTSVLLSFSDSSNNVDHYTLEYGEEKNDYKYGAASIGGKGTTTYKVNELKPNTTYYFRVRGGNGCATGAWSNVLSGRTLGSNIIAAPSDDFIVSSELVPVISDIICETHKVQAGDSLWKIAKELFGDGSRYRELIELNKDTYPSLNTSGDLAIGWEIKTNCREDSTNEETDTKNYLVTVKVIDTKGNPVNGATVTIHSKVQTTKTDKNGIAKLEKVPEGDHRVIIAYRGYEGEQSINLTGDVKEFTLNITVEVKSIWTSPQFLGIVGLLGFVIVVLLFIIRRNQKRS